MVKSIYNAVDESRNWDAKNVTIVDNNGNVTITSTSVAAIDAKPTTNLDLLTDVVENVLTSRS
mgnify:CR=1 FL=1|tara:strand:+ start:954 stop:1142 length:189 start_codon:yes stop_codon:yes gene_type:complete